MTTSPRFIHLRVHSAYSLLEGALQVKKLPDMAKAAGMPALAVTDTCNNFAALEFSEVAAKAGLQPIIGTQFPLAYSGPPQPGEKPVEPRYIVLLAQNETGWENLMRLNSCAYLDSGDLLPHLTLDELAEFSEGLICLTGGALGPLGQLIRNGHGAKAAALADRLSAMFPDRLYVELQRHPVGDAKRTEDEAASEPGLIQLAYAKNLPLVATNDVHFPNREMHEAHDALICIADGNYVDQAEPRRRLTEEHYFKTADEMAALFADLPEALENTVEIARRCAFRVTTRDPILPKFADDEVVELRRQANAGLQNRLAVIPHAVTVEEYQKRLDFELDIIEGMGFPGYFLIVADFIKWAKDHQIPVGPGRGSGAGSLVAYALTITDLDPLRYSLLFERFLNPERVSMPDFDIDFCMDRREEVIRYVQQKYGRDKVGQIITFGALLSKAAVRDVGRVLQMPYMQVDRLSKLIPVEGVKPVSIQQALIDEPRLKEEARQEEVVNRLLTIGSALEGLYRNASTHAAGVVIGDRPLDRLVPLFKDPRSDMPATQFNMKWVEQAGLVKFDFLGLKTLTVIQNALDLIKGQGTPLMAPPEGDDNASKARRAALEINPYDISAIPIDDQLSYDLYASAQTVAVFQVESSGMRDALRQMKPTCIEDIIALVALYRPGPMENIPTFCDVKNGRKDRALLHPTVDHILDETQGIIVYQEQVMQIAQDMAGYTLGGADMLRRAMGKKLQEAMDVERPKFLAGAAENDVDQAKAQEVWDLLDKFANYGFNKSHAAAYAVVSYQTAWLKANHPVEFMAGVMNCDIHLTDKLSVYKQEIDRLKIGLIPPCVNRANATFTVKDGQVIYALGGLKNVGVEAMRLITSARGDAPFLDLFDFARRVDLKRVGKRPLEMLARAGAFDLLDANRHKVFASLDKLVAYSAATHGEKNSSQGGLFGDAGEDLPAPRLPMPDDWLATERLAQEHQAIGFYLSGHPLDDYMPALRRKRVMTLAEVAVRARSGATVAKLAGTVSAKQVRKSARGNRFAFVSCSDPTGLYEVTVFGDTLEQAGALFDTGQNVVMSVEATLEGDSLKLLARGVTAAEDIVAEAGTAGLKIYLNDQNAVAAIAARLADSATGPQRGRGPVHLFLQHADLPGDVELRLKDEYRVSPQVKAAIKSAQGVVYVEEF